MYLFSLEKVKYKGILNIEELKILQGKTTCVLGESGSGKTTLLKLFNHLISPDSGTVLFQGEDIASLDPVGLRRRVLMLPQNPLIFPGTIKDNLNLGLLFSEKPAASDQNLELFLNMVNLPKELSAPAGELSGGEKQRLALARVLLMEPEAMLLDEPSSALDETTEKIIMDRLQEYVASKKKTLIMVTHRSQLAGFYADYIVYMQNGSILQTKEAVNGG